MQALADGKGETVECEDVQEILLDYIRGLVADDKNRHQIELHLESCSLCQESYNGIAPMTAILKVYESDEVEAEDDIEVPETFMQQIRAWAIEQVPAPIKKPPDTFLDKLKEWFSLSYLKPISAGLAIASLVAVISLNLWQGNQNAPHVSLQLQLNQAYLIVAADKYQTSLTGMKDNLVLPWEVRKKGDSSTKMPDAAKAFNSGVYKGRQSLINQPMETLPNILTVLESGQKAAQESDWLNSPWRGYYLMGEWVMILKGLCLLEDVSLKPVWLDQIKLKTRMDTLLKDERMPAQEVMEFLSDMESALTNRIDRQQSPDCMMIENAVGQLIQKMNS